MPLAQFCLSLYVCMCVVCTCQPALLLLQHSNQMCQDRWHQSFYSADASLSEWYLEYTCNLILTHNSSHFIHML